MDSHGFRFRDWPVYTDARRFRARIIQLVVHFPHEELYALADQTKRALSSILLNIAEGSNRNTDKDTKVYINRAQGSLDEVVACLDCALDSSYISHAQHEDALMNAQSLAKQLKRFSSYLATNSGGSHQGLKIND